MKKSFFCICKHLLINIHRSCLSLSLSSLGSSMLLRPSCVLPLRRRWHDVPIGVLHIPPSGIRLPLPLPSPAAQRVPCPAPGRSRPKSSAPQRRHGRRERLKRFALNRTREVHVQRNTTPVLLNRLILYLHNNRL